MSFWRTFVSVVCSFTLAGCKGVNKSSGDSITDFWVWFKAHENSLAEQHGPYDTEFDQLTSRLKTIDQRLAYEITGGNDDKKRIFISANANRDVLPLVQKVANAAPVMSRWEVIPFRPRATSEKLQEMAIPWKPASHGERVDTKSPSVRADEMRYTAQKAGDVVNITLYLIDYKGGKEQEYNAQLMVHEAVGEYDSMTRIGEITYRPLTKSDSKVTKPLVELPAEFDRL